MTRKVGRDEPDVGVGYVSLDLFDLGEDELERSRKQGDDGQLVPGGRRGIHLRVETLFFCYNF